MNDIFDAKHTLLTKDRLDNIVTGQRNSLAVDFSESTRVDESSDGFRGGISPSNTVTHLL